MIVVFLKSCDDDFEWIRIYYREIFPAGAPKADVHFARAVAVLEDNPYAGPALDGDLRIYSVRRTPFAYVYRLIEGRVEVVRLRDQRAAPDLLEFDA